MPFAFRHPVLGRPLAVLDLETTGVDTRRDRIVEVGVLRYAPGREPIRYRRRVHPGMAIPGAAVAVHGITAEDVPTGRTSARSAPRLARLLADADLAGFNLRRFDLPFLAAEFRRVGLAFPLAGRAVVDAQQIFHAREPRDLAAATRFYCGREPGHSHSALADAEAAAAVLDAQLVRYGDLPTTAAALHEMLTEVDIGGRFRREGGRVVFAFGKHLGHGPDEVAIRDPGYLRWFLDQDFLDDAKAVIRATLEGAGGMP